MEVENETPSKSSSTAMNRILANQMSCDSPFRFLSNVSTPPSRFTKVINPFESHLIERLHLPTFSPSVFAEASTPKSERKFKWSIDAISSLKPADIDETTVSQHINEYDPTVESIVQEKIDTFFKEKVIVPSPLNVGIHRVKLVETPINSTHKPEYKTSSAQTVLTLPPTLPQHIEDLLKPYFTFTDNQQGSTDDDLNASLHRKLFEFEEEVLSEIKSRESSILLPTTTSPSQLAIAFGAKSPTQPRNFEESITDISELRDCALSPISRSPSFRESRSACRLNFSTHMSIDASLVVPDVNHIRDKSDSFLLNQDTNSPLQLSDNTNSSPNWDMEYNHVSILSQSPVSSPPEIIDSSNSCTPHSKIFTSQRKRLSDSFKDEEEKDIEMVEEENFPKRVRNLTDTGYHTSENSTWLASHMVASTPTKYKN